MITVVIDDENENRIEGENLFIKDKNDVNHLKNSFRVKTGEKIRAVDGKSEYILEIIEIDKKEIICKILEINSGTDDRETEIDAAIGMLKNDKMNVVIQKLTEIGVDRIIPYFSKRCVVKLGEKKDKWDLISKEALKQCQGIKFMRIEEPVSIENLRVEEYDLVIVPYEANREDTIKALLSSLQYKPKKVLYIIGPEGGFEEKEIEALKEKNSKIVTLGDRILRAETAAIIVGGILINEFE